LSTAASSHTLEKRDYVIKELVETEKNYIEVLQNLQKYFMKTLEKHIFANEHSIIFCNIKVSCLEYKRLDIINFSVQELTDVHTNFYSKLQEAVAHSSQSGRRLGEVFIFCKSHFLIYGDYCANLPLAQELLHEICAKSEVLTRVLEVHKKLLSLGTCLLI
jgi:guanine nucleotide exchange factor VAV